jgi:hypothetical protein
MRIDASTASTSPAQGVLRADGLEGEALIMAPAFGDLRVSDGADTCIVDLVAEPFGPIAPPADRDAFGYATRRGTTFAIFSNTRSSVSRAPPVSIAH